MSTRLKGFLSALAVICLTVTSQTLSQGAKPTASSAKVTTERSGRSDVNRLEFDVVSIRRNDGSDTPSGFIKDGYKAVGMPLWRTIAYAYFPVKVRDPKWIKGAPSWVFDDRYDIIAKIAPKDVAAWQKLREKPSAEENPELQSMFEKLLEDRCQIKTHRIASEVDGYLLENVRGRKISARKPDESPAPNIIMSDDGGSVAYFEREGRHGWTFKNASVKLLLSFLSLFSGAPIRDKTNVGQRYNFTLEILDQDEAKSELQSQDSSNDFVLVQASLKDIGFRLTRSKVPLDLVVIDHIERPTAN